MLKKENWTVTWKSAGITAGLFALTTVVCALLQRLGLNEISQLRNETYVPLVYVLCVLLVSLLTDGYLCGTVVSLLSVFAVNYVFTYPYMNFNFSLSGYPLTFLTMLAVSLTVNTLTATLKRQERIRMEAETERMRANLLRAISHDLRTPLTAISGSAITLLENDNLPDWQKKKLLGSINDDAEWLIRMVENLLSVTRIGLESARIEKQDEVAEEVIFSAISKFKAHFPGVAVTPQLPESVMLVPMDPVLIQQVVDAQVGYWGRGCNIFLLLALAPEWDLHSSKDSLVPLLFLGQIGLSLFLHPFLQGDDVLAALHPHGLHQLRHHPLAEDGVIHLDLVGVGIG